VRTGHPGESSHMSEHVGEPVSFIGALSFEDRAIGALLALSGKQRRLAGVFLDYGSEATPGREAATLRNHQWDKMCVVAAEQNWEIERRSINPYSTSDLEEVLASSRESGERLVVDISCMTKVHVLASAAWLSSPDRFSGWTAAYARPKSYGRIEGRPSVGWRGTLTLPLGETMSMSNEGLAFGWVIAGPEGARTTVALDEIEPSAGLVSVLWDPERQDLFEATMAANAASLAHLGRLRLGGKRVVEGGIAEIWPSLGWETAEIKNDDLFGDLARQLSRILPAVSRLGAPIILYPIGPKVAVFAATSLLIQQYPLSSWAIYPAVATHPLDYSLGLKGVRWWDADALRF
jgi:hypothetical protein